LQEVLEKVASEKVIDKGEKGSAPLKVLGLSCLALLVSACIRRPPTPPGTRNGSGQSVLPAPKTGKLSWKTSLPAGLPITFDLEKIPVQIRPRNTNYVPPKSPPATLAKVKKFQHGDPPVVFQDTNVQAISSSILEPVAANNGNVVFYTANGLGGAASTDGGQTWSFTGTNANGQPVDLNGNSQCGCDQDVLYAPQINMFVWYRQGGGNNWQLGQQQPNSITLVDGSDPVNGLACSFTVFPSTVNSNWGAPYWFDFPAIALGVKDVYLTANVINNAGSGNEGAVIARFDLAALKNACFNGGTATLDFYEVLASSGGFGIGMAHGSPDLFSTMMFASHLQNDELTVYTWPESSDHTGVTSTNIEHTPYRPPSNEQCTVPDGGNPCASLQTWYMSGWADWTAGTVSFMWNAGAGPGSPFPYLDVVTVNAFPKATGFVSENQIWSPNFAFLVGAGGADNTGHPAVTAFIAGGSTSPTPVMLLPSETLLNWVQMDAGEASGTKTTNRWGDFLRVRPYFAGPGGSGNGWVVGSYFYPKANSQGGASLNYYEVSSNQEMAFAVALNPRSGSVNAGFNVATGVRVTSLNGIQTGPITMRVAGLSEGLIHLGTENLTGTVCTFPTPVTVGSSCDFNLVISTPATDPTGTHTLGVQAQHTPTVGTATGPESAGALYALTIGPSVGPSPNIVSPLDGAQLTVGANYTMTGWARSTDQAELFGFVPCSLMSFEAMNAGGTSQTVVPTADPSFQQTGYCDAQMQFNQLGSATLALNAKNSAGAIGQSQVSVTIVKQQVASFGFAIVPQQPGTRLFPGGSGTVTLTVSAVSGTPQPVQLSASDLPAGATFSFSSNPVNPTATVPFTVNMTPATPPGAYNVIVTGTDTDGTKVSTGLNFFVDAPAQ
jgi:hypothetical protein